MQGFEFVGATHIPDANGDYSAALIPSPPLAWDGFLKSTPDFLEVLGLRARMLGLGARYGLGWQVAIREMISHTEHVGSRAEQVSLRRP